MRKHFSQSGFTLIELLVVVAIIGLLASAVLASLNSARAKANDTKRLQDMQQIRNALELFHQDNGRYPTVADDNINSGGECIGIGDDIDNALRPYIDPIPLDPRHDVGACNLPGTFFYAYDPSHPVENCDTAVGSPDGIVYGFNFAESLTDLPKETCVGTDMNLDNADYNQVIYN